MGKKILITGGAGFIGTHTTEALIQAGHTVRVLDVLDEQVHGPDSQLLRALHPDTELIRGDVRDPEAVKHALRGIDVVYHFAARTSVTQSMYQMRDYLDVNVTGTGTLWEVIINEKLALEKFILASSRAVYGEGAYYCEQHGRIVYPELRTVEQLRRGVWEIMCPEGAHTAQAMATREDKRLHPLSVYGESKRMQEQLCSNLAANFGIPLVTLRYFNVYGPQQALDNPYTGIAPVFCTQLRAGKKIAIYEDGLPTRDFIHVQDIVQANLLALEYDQQTSSTFNIGSGKKLTILDLASAICDQMGVGEQWEFTGQYRVGDIRDCFADISAARQQLGFAPRIDFQEGVCDLLAWFEKQEISRGGYEQTVDEYEHRGLIRRSET